jgi:hypothetical protein
VTHSWLTTWPKQSAKWRSINHRHENICFYFIIHYYFKGIVIVFMINCEMLRRSAFSLYPNFGTSFASLGLGGPVLHQTSVGPYNSNSCIQRFTGHVWYIDRKTFKSFSVGFGLPRMCEKKLVVSCLNPVPLTLLQMQRLTTIAFNCH